MIYFLKPTESDGPIKIGQSVMPAGRMTVYQAWSPIPLEMMGCVDGGFSEERYIHETFKANRLHHEWFEASDDLMAFIDEAIAVGKIVIPTRVSSDKSDKYAPYIERIARMVEMRAEGKTLQEIGDAFSITRQRVEQILKKARTPPGLSKRIAKIEAIRKMADHGCTQAEIADRLGITYGYVYTLARENGIKIKKKTELERQS